LLDLLSQELGVLLAPLSRAVESDEALGALLRELGVLEQDDDGAALLGALNAVVELKLQIDAMAAEPEVSFDSVAALLDAVANAFEAIAAASDPASPFKTIEGLGRDLVDLLIAAWIGRWPVLRQVAVLLTLIDPAPEQSLDNAKASGDQLLRGPFQLDRVHIERLGPLLRDPVAVLKAAYVNALATDDDAAAMADKLFRRLVDLLWLLGISARYGVNPDDLPLLGDAGPLISRALIIYVDDLLMGAAAEAGIVLSLSPASRGDLGLVLAPFGNIEVSRQVGNWTFTSKLTAEVDALAWGRNGLTWPDSLDAAQVTGSITNLLAAPDTGPAYVIGDRAGTRLEIGGAKLSVETQLSTAAQALAMAADLSPAALVITAGDGDGFLASLIPAGGLRTSFDLAMTWSSLGGLSLRGGAGLEATLPVGFSAAGVTLSSIHLGIEAQDTGVSAEVSATLSAAIGPVTAVLDRIGVLGTVAPAPNGVGSFGSTDFRLGFKGPSGVGLTIDAGVVTGGGFLSFEGPQHLYAGELQLSIEGGLTVKAFGLITTGADDGGPKFSLVVFITVEDFTPIQLGMGFRLTGVGGILAIHRTFDEDAIRAGLKSDNLKSLLFPQNPAANAPALIQALAVAFPPKQGAYLVGLLIQIGWPTPTLVEMDLALILEFGDRNRLLVLGRISSLLPSRDNDLIRLNLDAEGVLDFDQGTVAIDAVLVDSRLAHRYPLTGAMALRARLKSGPGSSFVMAIGGLNQRFAPPDGLPDLPRVTIALCSGDNPRLTCEAYFAITANTVQFGSRADLYASAYGFSIQGDVGFDVLIELAPIHFIADFHAALQLKHGTTNLFKVSVDGALEGPRPLTAKGKASFEIFWCDFTISFDKTLVEGDPPLPPPAIDVTAELKQALLAPDSWSSEAGGHGVALRPAPIQGGAALDPASRLVLRQRVVPLNTARDIELFGGTPVTMPRHFQVSVSLAGQDQHANPIQDQFAPAQYFAMTDDEKLAAPSFETMDAGLVFGDAVAFDPAESIAAPLQYETLTFDDEAAPPPPDQPPHQITLDRLALFVRSGAAGRAAARRTGRKRFANTEAVPAVAVQPLTWVVTPLGDGPAAPPEAAKTWSELQAALGQLNRGGAAWQLAPTHELAA
jgi:hypothetical protein